MLFSPPAPAKKHAFFPTSTSKKACFFPHQHQQKSMLFYMRGEHMTDAEMIRAEIAAPGPARRFPILSPKLLPAGERDRLGLWIPWSEIEPLRAAAMLRHGQTLERLAARGGLSRSEIAGLQSVRK